MNSVTRRNLLKTIGLTGGGSIAGVLGINALTPLVLPQRLVFDSNRSYWSAALPPPNPKLRQDLHVDVAIVGGGFTGLSAAYYLAKNLPGRQIALLEAKACGNGASGRNGAMVLNTLKVGVESALARRMYELTADNVQRLKALSTATGIDCELAQNGALTVMVNADQSQGREDFEFLQRSGLPLQMWDRNKIAATVGAQVYESAVFDPRAGQVHPGKLVRMWKSLAETAGVKIYEQTAVTDIVEGSTHTLTTADGYVIRAPQLVMATNAYSSKLGYFRGAVAPVAEYVGATPVLGESQLRAVGWRDLIPFNDSRTEVYYAGLTRDRRIHFGGGPIDYGFNDGMDVPRNAAARHAALHVEFARIFPSLAAVPFEITWSGFVDVSLDKEPSVGRMGRHGNVFYGIGYSGDGVNMTSVFGRIIADVAAGKNECWGWYPYLNRRLPYVPNEPFRWLGIKADLAYTRATE